MADLDTEDALKEAYYEAVKKVFWGQVDVLTGARRSSHEMELAADRMASIINLMVTLHHETLARLPKKPAFVPVDAVFPPPAKPTGAIVSTETGEICWEGECG